MSVLDQQMAERRERIIEAARELIEAKGFHGLTMRDLASASRVTVPTIYNLIGSKEQVLFAAVEEQTLLFVAGLERVRGDLIGVVEATVRELLRRPLYYRALVLILLSSESADPARRYVEHAVAEQIDAALAELESKGSLATWVDRAVLAERLHSHLDMTCIEWARGALTATSFRAAARFEAATLMLGPTTGNAHAIFQKIARGSQADAKRRRKRTREREHAA